MGDLELFLKLDTEAYDREGVSSRTSFFDRLLCTWNNLRHAQYFPVKFPNGSPIFLLGVRYSKESEEDEEGLDAAPYYNPGSVSRGRSKSGESSHIIAMRKDIFSRPWLTYREGFPNIGTSRYTNDVGWGCMLRAGQMLLAHALIVLHFGRGWRYEPKSADEALHKKYTGF